MALTLARGAAAQAALAAATFAAAFAFRGRECVKAFDGYLLTAAGAVVVAVVAPWLTTRAGAWARLGLGVGGSTLVIAAWVGGMAVTGIRLMCRLF